MFPKIKKKLIKVIFVRELEYLCVYDYNLIMVYLFFEENINADFDFIRLPLCC